MNLIFRIPLFDFEINDPHQLEQNWKKILEAIEVSSPDLFNSIAYRPFASLPEPLQLKVRKYLIRGRYRPTPFGKLAGMGLANWSETTQGPPSLKPLFHQNQASDTCKLSGKLGDQVFIPMPGLTLRFGYHQAITYDKRLAKWCLSKIEQNDFLDRFLSIAYQNIAVDTRGIKPEPKKVNLDEDILEELLSTGFVYPSPQYSSTVAKSINSEVQDPMLISYRVKAILDQFIAESGGIFIKSKNAYLNDFISWFVHTYDDRQICLYSLLSESDFLEKQMTFGKTAPPPKPAVQHNLSESLDLKKHVTNTCLPKGIYDLQLVFRIGADGNPLIENMVCNRPFAYLGRFNQYPDFLEYGKALKESIYDSDDFIFAQLDLFESPKAQAICEGVDLFEWKIGPFPRVSEKQIELDDIWIGVEGERVYLWHPQKQKEIIPVVLHPLHGDQITHPIMKLLWQIALQDQFKFLAYTPNGKNLATGFELKWGNLIIQPKSWKLKRSSFETQDSFLAHIRQEEIPCKFLAGIEDRELLIQKEILMDQEILWQELNRSGELTLNEAPWIESDQIFNSQGIPLFPQFIYRFTQPLDRRPVQTLFNPIYFSDQNWIYLILKTPYSDLLETLEYIRDFFYQEGFKYKAKWYYLVYQKSGDHEIRLRVNTPKKASKFLLSITNHLDLEEITWTRAPYYPETEKYGFEDYAKSEHLFCLESEFLFSYNGEYKINLLLPQQQKLCFLTGHWIWIIYSLGKTELFFEYFKSLCKNLKNELTGEFKSRFSYLKSHESYGFQDRKYLEILRSHPFIWNDYSKIFLVNHMHMMVNRFFPLETRAFEQELWYRIYRELGKRRYALSKSKNLENEDWLVQKIQPNPQITRHIRSIF